MRKNGVVRFGDDGKERVEKMVHDELKEATGTTLQLESECNSLK